MPFSLEGRYAIGWPFSMGYNPTAVTAWNASANATPSPVPAPGSRATAGGPAESACSAIWHPRAWDPRWGDSAA